MSAEPKSQAGSADGTTPFAETKALLVIGAPLAAAYLAEIAMMLTDIAIVGRLGSHQLAAVGLAGDLMFEIMFGCMAIVSIAGVLVAEAIGADEQGSVGRHVRAGLILSTVMCVPAMLLTWNLPTMLSWTGQDPAVLAYGEAYLHTAVWCFLPAVWFVVLREFVAALSRPRSVMVITIAAVGLNAVLTYGLVFGEFGLPALGVQGAGAATSVVCWVMFGALTWHVVRAAGIREFRIFAPDFRGVPEGCREILVLGLPLGGLALMGGGLFAVTAILVGSISADALAANQIVFSVISVTFVVITALGEATAIRVAYAAGLGNPAQGRRAGLLGLGMGSAFMAVAAILFLSAPHLLSALFIDASAPENTAVIELASALFAVAGVFQIFDGLQSISSYALRGMRDTFAPMWIAGLGYWGFGIPGGYILGFVLGYGAVGIWWGMALGLSITALMLTRRFLRLSWKRRMEYEAREGASGAGLEKELR